MSVEFTERAGNIEGVPWNMSDAGEGVLGERDAGWADGLADAQALLSLGMPASDVLDVLRAASTMSTVEGSRERITAAFDSLIAYHQERRMDYADARKRYLTGPSQQTH